LITAASRYFVAMPDRTLLWSCLAALGPGAQRTQSSYASPLAAAVAPGSRL